MPDIERFRFAPTEGTQFKVTKSGDPEQKGAYQMVGYASVFNRLSHDLGGFRAQIHPGYFTKILDSGPDVHLNREHNMERLLARTRNGSLELQETPHGLRTWARFSPTALADETAILMRDGVLDQMSFATHIGASEWTEDKDGNITWHLLEGESLEDVAICAQGAFPQTRSDLVASLSNASEMFAAAKAEGKIKKLGTGIIVPESAALSADNELDVAPEGVGQEQEIIAPHVGEGGTEVAPEVGEGARVLAELKASAKEARARHYSE